MVYYDETNMHEMIDVAENNNRKEYVICQYWICNHRFKFQDSVCNQCLGLTMFCLINVRDIAIITVKVY